VQMTEKYEFVRSCGLLKVLNATKTVRLSMVGFNGKCPGEVRRIGGLDWCYTIDISLNQYEVTKVFGKSVIACRIGEQEYGCGLGNRNEMVTGNARAYLVWGLRCHIENKGNGWKMVTTSWRFNDDQFMFSAIPLLTKVHGIIPAVEKGNNVIVTHFRTHVKLEKQTNLLKWITFIVVVYICRGWIISPVGIILALVWLIGGAQATNPEEIVMVAVISASTLEIGEVTFSMIALLLGITHAFIECRPRSYQACCMTASMMSVVKYLNMDGSLPYKFPKLGYFMAYLWVTSVLTRNYKMWYALDKIFTLSLHYEELEDVEGKEKGEKRKFSTTTLVLKEGKIVPIRGPTAITHVDINERHRKY